MNFFVQQTQEVQTKRKLSGTRASPQKKINGEFLYCPICLELPRQEVYQCRNGHTICQTCISDLKVCPQCRIPFESEKIRNRLLETLLDRMEIQCPHWKNGCEEVLQRQNLTIHANSCKFGPLNLCKLLWKNDCDFSSSNLKTITEHMKTSHGAQTLDSQPSVTLTLKDFQSFATGKCGTYPTCWITQVANATFIIFLTISGKSDLSFHCLYDGLEESVVRDYNIAYKISDDNSKTNIMSWTMKPTYFKSVNKILKSPSVQLDTNHIISQLSGASMSLSISIPFPVDYFVDEAEIEMVINEWLKQKHNLWMRLAGKSDLKVRKTSKLHLENFFRRKSTNSKDIR